MADIKWPPLTAWRHWSPDHTEERAVVDITLLWCHDYARWRRGDKADVDSESPIRRGWGCWPYIPNHSIEWVYSHYSCMSTMQPLPLHYNANFIVWGMNSCLNLFFFWFMFCDFSSLSVIRFHRKSNIPVNIKTDIRRTNRAQEEVVPTMLIWGQIDYEPPKD